jgi:hypothetical protein
VIPYLWGQFYVEKPRKWMADFSGPRKHRTRYDYIWSQANITSYEAPEFHTHTKPETKLQFCIFQWVHNIKTDLREIGWDGRDWIDLDQDRDQWRALVKTVKLVK